MSGSKGAIVRILTADEVRLRISEIAALRIKIFQDFPYIYDGSIDYEVKYLGRYLQAPNARFIGAFSEAEDRDENLIGIATCLPLSEEENFVKEPFLNAGFKPEDVFYFGESVLLPQYRGQKVGHRFFDEREKVAREFGSTYTSFCAVHRPENHPLRPQNYRPLDEFWRARGYEKKPELTSTFEWKDVDQDVETGKTMVYWLRRLK
ncbi:GNAT family N-acetyltransferase [Pseudobdellovibrio exovorus]|uniref:N-acetyltransferase domain-containing protein n=1 Tax=Pseudobdellovibrio exovorus JSS TaxID=1184267 RepID=M4VU30_9BACT|nr:GNAT family N-acetyltransferase [Pseudobdellovibrio exovorus]AGH96724.1 hypothetical protein A11Q_2508 [Pseudobdellovibrio exovorus JSS]